MQVFFLFFFGDRYLVKCHTFRNFFHTHCLLLLPVAAISSCCFPLAYICAFDEFAQFASKFNTLRHI